MILLPLKDDLTKKKKFPHNLQCYRNRNQIGYLNRFMTMQRQQNPSGLLIRAVAFSRERLAASRRDTEQLP